MSDQCEKQKVGKHKKLFTQYNELILITCYMFAVMRMQFNQIFAHKPQLIEAMHRALGENISRLLRLFIYCLCGNNSSLFQLSSRQFRINYLITTNAHHLRAMKTKQREAVGFYCLQSPLLSKRDWLMKPIK